jgi:hypothetical protein
MHIMPVISATWEAEIRRIVVQDQPGQNISKIPSQQYKPGVVLHSFYPSYTGGIGKTIIVHGWHLTKT